MNNNQKQSVQANPQEWVESELDSKLKADNLPATEACTMVEEKLLPRLASQAIIKELQLEDESIVAASSSSFWFAGEAFLVLLNHVPERHVLRITVQLALNKNAEDGIVGPESLEEELDARSIYKYVCIITHPLFDVYHKRLIDAVRRVWQAGMNRLEAHVFEFAQQTCNSAVKYLYSCLRAKLGHDADEVILFFTDERNGVYICDDFLVQRIHNQIKDQISSPNLSSLKAVSYILATVMDLQLTEANKATLARRPAVAIMSELIYRTLGDDAGNFQRSEQLWYRTNEACTHPLIMTGEFHLSAAYPAHLAPQVSELLNDKAFQETLEWAVKNMEMPRPSKLLSRGGILIDKSNIKDTRASGQGSENTVPCDVLKGMLVNEVDEYMELVSMDVYRHSMNFKTYTECCRAIEMCHSEAVLQSGFSHIKESRSRFAPIEVVLKNLRSLLQRGSDNA